MKTNTAAVGDNLLVTIELQNSNNLRQDPTPGTKVILTVSPPADAQALDGNEGLTNAVFIRESGGEFNNPHTITVSSHIAQTIVLSIKEVSLLGEDNQITQNMCENWSCGSIEVTFTPGTPIAYCFLKSPPFFIQRYHQF